MSIKNQNNRRPLIIYIVIAMAILFFINAFIVPNLFTPNVENVSYNEFLDQVDQGEVAYVELQSESIIFTLTADVGEGEDTAWSLSNNYTIYETGLVQADNDLVDRLLSAGVTFREVYPAAPNPIWSLLIGLGFPILIFIVVGRLLTSTLTKRSGGMNSMQFGKSGAKIYVPQAGEKKIFSDVAGQEEAKESLSEVVDFLHDPKKYEAIGASCPKGVLLVGPPGTGKTLLAKAVAGEANVPFFSIAGSEFVQMFVGMGANKVRDLFKQATEKAPCIVFIDEIDTIGKKRDGMGMTSNDEREQTLNQLLTEMDGFDANKGVVILAATNRPDSLDPALLRPGRFDRRVTVELPDLAGREAILRVHARKVKMNHDVDFAALARQTAGTSGAELANMINEAAMRAVRAGRQAIIQGDLEESVDVVLAGEAKTSAVINPKEKKIIAYHEVGHALVAAKLSGSAPVQKITIIPRSSGALGFTMQAETGDRYLYSKEDLMNNITTLTGGRAAEELVFNLATTGAANDIEKATQMARNMVSRYGMTDDFGMTTFVSTTDRYLGGQDSMAGSDDTAARIDRSIIEIIKAAHQAARNILKENMDKLHEIAEFLLDKETITGKEFMDILEGNVPESNEGFESLSAFGSA